MSTEIPKSSPSPDHHSLESLAAQYGPSKYGPSDFFEKQGVLPQMTAANMPEPRVAEHVEQTPDVTVSGPKTEGAPETPPEAADRPSMAAMRLFATMTAREIREDDPTLSLAEANNQALAATRSYFGIPEPEPNEPPAAETDEVDELPAKESAAEDLPSADADSSAEGDDAHDEVDKLYEQKITVIERHLKTKTDKDLEVQLHSFIRAVRGNASRIDIWEALKEQQAATYARQTSDILRAGPASWKKPGAEMDTIDRVITAVAQDKYGSDPDRFMAGPDTYGFTVGGELGALLETDALKDPATLARATGAIRLLVAHGQYKLLKWNSTGQLERALQLMENYAEWVPDFKPEDAGANEAYGGLVMALAALRADANSKPNYPYAKPERRHLFAQFHEGLERLRRVEAHVLLRTHDIDLSAVPSSTDAEQPS